MSLRKSFVRVQGTRKIFPKYSMLARVHDFSTVRFFGTGATQEVHIQNARSITLPTNLVLKNQ